MSAPNPLPAGWYPDPAGQTGQRWWDGGQWTEQTQPPAHPVETLPTAAPYLVPPPAPAPSMPTGKYDSKNAYNPVMDREHAKNTPARNALVLGILCLLVNPVLLPSIGAIIWGIVGISRANQWAAEGYPPTGKNKAIWGLVLGCLGLAGSILLKGFLL